MENFCVKLFRWVAAKHATVPSVVLMSLGHQEVDLPVKSFVITDNDGLQFFLSVINFLKLDKNKSYSSLFWLA